MPLATPEAMFTCVMEAAMRKALLSCAALLALATPTFAQPYPPQINLTWNDCLLGPFAVDMGNACTSNAGLMGTLIESFSPPDTVPRYVGNSAVIDLQTSATTLSPWWQIGSSVSDCRRGSLSTSADFTAGPNSCADFWAGRGAVSGYSYVTPSPSIGTPNSARLRAAVSVAESFAGPIDNSKMWYALKVSISNIKTVGTGSCAGCLDGACIVINEMRLVQPVPTPDVILTTGPQQYVTYRGGAGTSHPCPASTPTHQRTWGSVKALYR